MTAQRIDPVLVEKVQGELEDNDWCLYRDHDAFPILECEFVSVAEAAIRVVLDELGLKEEQTVAASRSSGGREVLHRHYVSDWRPVEQGDTDGD